MNNKILRGLFASWRFCLSLISCLIDLWDSLHAAKVNGVSLPKRMAWDNPWWTIMEERVLRKNSLLQVANPQGNEDIYSKSLILTSYSHKLSLLQEHKERDRVPFSPH